MFTFFAGLAAKLAASAFIKKGAGFLSMVPKPVWEVLTVLAYVLALFALHQHYAHIAIENAHKAGYAQRATEDAKFIEKMRKRVETFTATTNQITSEVRQRHDQDLRDHAARADTLILRGPGKARCGPFNAAAVPVSSGGHEHASASGAPVDDGMAAMSPTGGADLAAVSWPDTVEFARGYDDLASEVRAWHTWYPKMAAEWEKLRQSLSAKPK